ncbi:hypothetical protein [Candidatus Hakubella thermalkaliphila]|nr:hypothetical protein [Candidatus Hakubella thermalkaliphila]
MTIKAKVAMCADGQGATGGGLKAAAPGPIGNSDHKSKVDWQRGVKK